jgi:hypothetical protein
MRQPAPGGLAVEVRPLRLAESDDLLLAGQQVIQLSRLAGEELLVIRVQYQQRRGDPVGPSSPGSDPSLPLVTTSVGLGAPVASGRSR